jgi:tRNA(Ile)-lysidine synthase
MNEDAVEQVRRQVRDLVAQQIPLPGQGEPLVVGVSGGADSLCLLHVLRSLQPDWGYELLAGHLDHGLRDESADDARFAASVCERWQVPVVVERFDVAGLARMERLSAEEAARKARYAFLSHLAMARGGNVVAVAHQADDQAETILMHLLRGAGTQGLAGMLPLSRMEPPVVDQVPWGHRSAAVEPMTVVRPLLTTTRAQVEAYCREIDMQPRQDRSNLDTSLLRNRVRHELIPYLESYNPQIRRLLQRTASLAADDEALIERQVQGMWGVVVVREDEDRIELWLKIWSGLPAGMQRRVLREAIRRLRGDLRDVGWEHVERALRCLHQKPAGAVETLVRGLELRKGSTSFQVGEAGLPMASPWDDGPLLCGEVTLHLEGVVVLPGSDWQVETVAGRSSGSVAFRHWAVVDQWRAVLDADRVEAPLTLRARRGGDRFQPLGMGGRSTTVKEYMIDQKLPRHLRDRWPLLCVGEEIAWVVGLRVDERFALSDTTERGLVVQFRRGQREQRSDCDY